MKKNLFYPTLLFVSFLFVSFLNAQAQKPFKSILQLENNTTNKTVTDTIKPLSFVYGTLTLDSALAGGYVCGTNAYNDMAKAQIYHLQDSLSYMVSGCALYIGKLNINDTTQKLKINFYDLTGSGYTTDSLILTGAPGYILDAIEVPVNTLVENQLNYFYLTNEMWAMDNYAIGIDFSDFGTNQIGLISTTHGDALESELAWEQLSNGQWYSMLRTWPFDADMGIFSLINSTNAAIGNQTKTNQFNIFPNPVQNNILNLTLDAPFATTAELLIYNCNGTIVYSTPINLVKGNNMLKYTLPLLKSSTYFISIKTPSNNFIKKLSVL